MFVVDEKEGGVGSLPAQEVTPGQARALSSPLAQKIVGLLAKEASYPKAIARRLRVHEQKVYYHIGRLHKAKVITAVRREYVQGASAIFYALAQPAFVMRFADFEPNVKLQGRADAGLLSSFVKNGKLDAVIVVGSPDPHGPEMARSKDGHYALDLALFIGSFLTYSQNLVVRLDTEITDAELKRNLIVIGGPIVNAVTGKLNNRLPVRFDVDSKYAIRSIISGKLYEGEAYGIVSRVPNPWNPASQALVVAGTRQAGTRAVVLAFLRHFAELSQGSIEDKRVAAKIVQGIDADGDGVVDDAKILE